MAKVAFSKLKYKINEEEVAVQLGEETVMVKQYLPISDKLQLISKIINQAHEEDYNFSNPVKADIILKLEMIEAYTNLTFTDKQKDDPAKIYDLLETNGAFKIIFSAIPQSEIEMIKNGAKETIEALYHFQNSAVGIVTQLSSTYTPTENQVNNLQETITNLSQSPFLQTLLAQD